MALHTILQGLSIQDLYLKLRMPTLSRSAALQPLTGKFYSHFKTKVSRCGFNNECLLTFLLVDLPYLLRHLRAWFSALRRFDFIQDAHRFTSCGGHGDFRPHEWCFDHHDCFCTNGEATIFHWHPDGMRSDGTRCGTAHRRRFH